MRKFYILIILIVAAIQALSQVPQGISYQAVARNSGGSLIKNTIIGIKISILDGGLAGTVQYSETHSATTNDYGLFNIVIGSGTVVSGSFAAVTWNNGNKYLKVEMDPAGGPAYTNMGTMKIQSVPFALVSDSVINDQDKQTLTLSGNDLSISNGNSITLPVYLSAVLTDATITGNGTVSSPLTIARQGATSGQVLKWNGSNWIPADDVDTDSDNQYLTLTGNDLTISNGNTVSLPSCLSTVITDATLTGSGTVSIPLKIARQGATSGQVLKWNGSNWVPSDDLDTNDNQTLSLAGSSLTISGGNTVILPSFMGGSGNPGCLSKFNTSSALTNSIIYENSGLIGIGINNPAELLHIYKSSTPARLLVENAATSGMVSSVLRSNGGVNDQFYMDKYGSATTSTVSGLPSAKLSVLGTGPSAGGMLFNIQSNNSFSFANNGSVKMKLDSLGNLGIGTCPNYNSMLHIHMLSASPVALTQYTSNTTGNGSGDGTIMGLSNSNGDAVMWNYENQQLQFGTSGTLRMIVTSDGKIGIGTASPSNLLHLSGNTTSGTIQMIENTINNGSSSLFLKTTGGIYDFIELTKWAPSASGSVAGVPLANLSQIGSGAMAGPLMLGVKTNNSMYFTTNNTVRMKIDSIGNVAIGTLSPTYKLHVVAPSTTKHTGYFRNSYPAGTVSVVSGVPLTSASICVIGEYTGNGSSDGIGVYGKSTNTNTLYGYGGFFEGNYIGLVGRGTTGGYAGVYAYSNGATQAIFINGNLSGTGTNNYASDLKLKRNIRPVEGALMKIMSMKPSVYQFKVGEFGSMELPSGDHYGLIAQELQKIYPELVSENDFNGANRDDHFKYLGINYQELTPILIKAIQEQQEEIEYLKKKVEELEKKIN